MKISESARAFHKYCAAFLCFLFFCLPLVMNRGYANVSATKSFCFLASGCAFVLIAAVFAVSFAVLTEKNPLRRPVALDMAFLALCSANIISASLSSYGADVWLGRTSRLQGAAVVLLYGTVYYVVSCGIKGISKNSKIFFALLSGFAVVSAVALCNSLGMDVFGVFNGATEEQRSSFISTIGNVNFFSAYVCLCLPVVTVLFAFCEERGRTCFFGALSVLGGIAAVLTSSDSFVLGMGAFLTVAPFFFFSDAKRFIRYFASVMTVYLAAALFYHIYVNTTSVVYEPSALLVRCLSFPAMVTAAVFVGVVCFFAHRNKGFLKAFKWVYLVLAVCGIIAAAVIVILANTHWQDKDILDLLIIDDDWGSRRGLIYRLCFEALGEYSVKDLLFGVGPEMLQRVMAKYGIPEVDQAHCEYLQILMTTGVFGLLSHLTVIGLTVISAVKRGRKNPAVVALLLGLLAYWSQASVNIAQSFTNPIVFAFIGLIGSEYRGHTSVKTRN